MTMVKRELNIIHFNDVYDAEGCKTQEHCGGCSRFVTMAKSLSLVNPPLVLFSGDALSPSFISNFTKGEHMVHILNKVGVNCACIGNHDFDFGVDHLCEMMQLCSFPWLLSNVIDKFTNEPLCKVQTSYIIKWEDWKVGILGIVESEWISTLATIDSDDVIVLDPVHTANLLSTQLKKQGCDIIIALTHMRWPNNCLLAENVEDIDLILAGHDHFYKSELINGKLVIVSGCDFKFLTQIIATKSEVGKLHFVANEFKITQSIDADKEMEAMVSSYAAKVDEMLDKVIGNVFANLDGRFSIVRTEESNLGNFVADICCSACNAECCILNSGTFRSDRIHEAGAFTMRDLVSILPFLDSLTVLNINGERLLAALENGVSAFPTLEGRFPQVSGIRFAFDPNKEPGSRIDPRLVIVNDEPLDLLKEYKLCVKTYLADGKDGYTSFADCVKLIDLENAPMLCNTVLNFFESVDIVSHPGERRSSMHHQHLLSRRSSIVVKKLISQQSIEQDNRDSKRGFLIRQSSIKEVEHNILEHVLNPRVSRRIIRINSVDTMESLLKEFDRKCRVI